MVHWIAKLWNIFRARNASTELTSEASASHGTPMTREEHITRAMLMGYDLYKEKGGYYVKYGHLPMGEDRVHYARIDAINLEPLTLDEARDRNVEADRTGKKTYYD
jgi:hypothetical protein